MRANEWILRVGLAAALCLLIVNVAEAIQPLPRGSCTWTRPGTLSVNRNLIDAGILISAGREQREFQGVWGRLSNGEVICFSPGRTRHKEATPTITTPTCTETTTEVCEETELCEEKCHWEWNCHCQCWNWHNWHWEQECEEECHPEQECHEETQTTCS